MGMAMHDAEVAWAWHGRGYVMTICLGVWRCPLSAARGGSQRGTCPKLTIARAVLRGRGMVSVVALRSNTLYRCAARAGDGEKRSVTIGITKPLCCAGEGWWVRYRAALHTGGGG